MTRIKYLIILILLLGWGVNILAQNGFNPESPAEPGPPGSDDGSVPMLTLVASPTEGGTVSGSGWYEVGSSISLRAYNKTNYTFSKWTNEQGEVVSTTSQFNYTKKRGNETLTAHFKFSPGSPAEPSEIAQQIYYTLSVKAQEGGTVSGGGKYLPNTRVYVSASVNTGYSFAGWYNSNGDLLATTTGYYYTTTTANETLTARFLFSPSNPSEPTTPVFTKKHRLTATAEEGGTVNTGETFIEEGKTFTLKATANVGYVFSGWYVDEELVSSNSSYTITMGTSDIAMVARFVFNPGSPGEPSKPTNHKYAFYLMNYIIAPGKTVDYPIYLTSLDPIEDISFQLTFDPVLKPNLESIQMSVDASGYDVSYSVENDTVYAFTLVGGNIPAGNIPIMVLSVTIPETVKTATGYPIKINQVTVEEADGTMTTASTRNGRISVYKLGDVNGDDFINVGDIVTIMAHIVGDPTDTFIEEVADVAEDKLINVGDVVNLMNIITESEE